MREVIYLIFVISCCMLIYNLWMTFIQPRIDNWISYREFVKQQGFEKHQKHNRTMEQLKYDTWKAERKLEKMRKHNTRKGKA